MKFRPPEIVPPAAKDSAEYRLEYKWGKAKIVGTVKVTNNETTESHVLWCEHVRLAKYRRILTGRDVGETHLFFRSFTTRYKVGTGNLLAGVLFWYWSTFVNTSQKPQSSAIKTMRVK